MRRVAIKIMGGLSFGERQALRRFEREAQACARLTHPNVVTVFDFGSVGADGAFLVMELVQGRTLRNELDSRGNLPAAVAATWFEQICEGVAAAHQHHVVHRDLKPENVLIAPTATGGDIVKALDFGLAKVRTATGEGDSFTHPTKETACRRSLDITTSQRVRTIGYARRSERSCLARLASPASARSWIRRTRSGWL